MVEVNGANGFPKEINSEFRIDRVDSRVGLVHSFYKDRRIGSYFWKCD